MLFLGLEDAFEQVSTHVVPDLFTVRNAVAKIRDGLVLDAEVGFEDLANRFPDPQTPKILKIG